MALSGLLADFPLDGVLRLLESSRKTGILEISAASEVGRLEITAGAVSAAYADDEKGEGAVAAILAMTEGNFAFRPQATLGPANLSGSLDEILGRARGEHERRAAVRKVIPNDRMRFELSPRALSGGNINIAPEHWKVLLNVDGRRDVQALATLLGETRIRTLERLNDLVTAGLIDPREGLPEEKPAPEPPRRAPAAPEPPVFREPARPAPRSEPPARPEPARPEPERPAATFQAPPAPAVQAPEPPAMAKAPAPKAAEPAPRPPEREAPAKSSWPAPEPPAATDDLSKLLEQRLAALDRPSLRTPQSPQDFWEQVQQRGAPPEPTPFVPEKPAPNPTADTDERLAAIEPSPFKASPEPPLFKTRAETAPSKKPAEQTPFGGPRREEPVASHYLPPDTTAPILELDETQQEAPKEEKRRGLFGFGRKKEATSPQVVSFPPAAPAAATSSAGRLASFANALIAEYNSGQYGKQRLDERMNVRLRLVDEQADPLERMLPVQDDRLDVGAIDRDFPSSQASPYLATLVRQVFDDAERLFGRDKAKKGYRNAIKNALGGDERVLQEGLIAPILPKL